MSSHTRLSNGNINDNTNLQDNKNNVNIRPYRLWKGNNTILCEGRIIGGPQKQNYIYTLILIIIPTLSFTIGVCNNFMHKYNLIYPLIIYLFLVIISIISLTLTAFSDPGIIPRNIISPTYKGPNHLKQQLCINGSIIEIKWCSTCHIFRPPRSFHCYICNNCVERFDHHCPWIGNCIGIRNYLYFSLFVNFLQLTCFWCLSYCIYILYLTAISKSKSTSNTKNQFLYTLKHEWCAFATAIYVFIGMWFVIGLTWFHWFLVWIGKTTNEQLRNLHPAGSPFKRSILGNVIDMCCKLPKSSIHLHSISPTGSYNELYINKQKVKILDDNEVNEHLNKTHSFHMSCSYDNSFKQCLINNNNNDTKKHENTNKIKNKKEEKLIKTKSKYEQIEIQQINSNKQHKNGNIQIGLSSKTTDNDNDNKIEEEEDDVKDDIKQDIKEEEEEENKYNNDNDNDNDVSKSIPRKDDNIDQENLYTSYDDDDDDDDDDGGNNNLNPSSLYNQYSRDVTPETQINNQNILEPNLIPNINSNTSKESIPSESTSNTNTKNKLLTDFNNDD